MPSHTLAQFAKRVRQLRLKQKLSQEKLAELADLHINSIGRIERLQLDPTATTIVKLARALRVKPAELFRGIR